MKVPWGTTNVRPWWPLPPRGQARTQAPLPGPGSPGPAPGGWAGLWARASSRSPPESWPRREAKLVCGRRSLSPPGGTAPGPLRQQGALPAGGGPGPQLGPSWDRAGPLSGLPEQAGQRAISVVIGETTPTKSIIH